MARTSEAVFDTTGTVRTPLNEIPQDLKDFMEDVYKRQVKRPGRERITYGDEKELKDEFKLMADYAAQRPEGVWKIRKSPTKGLADNVMDLRIVADVEANGARNAGNDRRQPVGQQK